MQIDLEHLHYWMCAIRDSADPKRTLDAFWKGQIDSKLWLIENLKNFIDRPVTIDILGGWVGVLSSMIFQSDISVKSIRSIDIDPTVQSIASMMNKKEEIEGRFQSILSNMCDFNSNADVIINTSCEHLSQNDYDIWLSNLPISSLLVLQSNNYDIQEHIRISNTLEEFQDHSQINVLWSGILNLPLYKRFMIIGKK
jgi:hypothetical protein